MNNIITESYGKTLVCKEWLNRTGSLKTESVEKTFVKGRRIYGYWTIVFSDGRQFDTDSQTTIDKAMNLKRC